jgi:hypothetical protein
VILFPEITRALAMELSASTVKMAPFSKTRSAGGFFMQELLKKLKIKIPVKIRQKTNFPDFFMIPPKKEYFRL